MTDEPPTLTGRRDADGPMLTIADQSTIDPSWQGPILAVAALVAVVWALLHLAVRAGERRIHRAHVETGVRAERGHCPLCDGLPITWDGGQ